MDGARGSHEVQLRNGNVWLVGMSMIDDDVESSLLRRGVPCMRLFNACKTLMNAMRLALLFLLLYWQPKRHKAVRRKERK